MSGKNIAVSMTFINKITKPLQEAYKGIEKTAGRLQDMSKKTKETGESITNMGKVIKSGVTDNLVSAVKSGINFESSFADVKKSVNATDKQFADLKKGILDMSTKMPSSASAISAVAESAGDLGIKADNVLDFTKVMIDFGNATNMSAEDGATALSKYAEATGMSQKDFDKLGSTIVALSNNFSVTESDVVQMASKLAGAGSKIGLTNGDIMGFAAALSSVGVDAETGGDAFNSAMKNMRDACQTNLEPVKAMSKKTGMSLKDMQSMSVNNSKGFVQMAQSLGCSSDELEGMIKAGVNLENFADIAGMTSEQFKKSYQKDAAGALQSFTKGLGNTTGKGKDTIKMLEDMGFSGDGLKDSLSKLNQGGDGIAKAVNIGNTAWAENTALTKEANKQYETTESKIEVVKNKVSALGIQMSDAMLPTVTKIIDAVSKVVTWFSHLNSKTQNSIVKIAGITAIIGQSLIMIGKLVSSVGIISGGLGSLGKATVKTISSMKKIKNIGKYFKSLKNIAKIGKSFKSLGNIAKIGKSFKSLGNITKVGKYFKIFANIVKTAFLAVPTPVKIVVLAIALIAGLAFVLIKNWSTVKKHLNAFGNFIKKIFAGLCKNTMPFIVMFILLRNSIKNGINKIKGNFTKLIGGMKAIIAYVTGTFMGNWGKAWKGITTIFKNIVNGLGDIIKAPLNGIISTINNAISSINKFGFKLPKWIPILGGKSFSLNIKPIKMLAGGTNNWQGGLAQINEPWIGGEIVDLPKGSRVYPHDKSVKKAYQDGASKHRGSAIQITVQKLADKIEVRSDNDIDVMVEKLAYRLKKVIDNGGGEVVPA